MISSFFDRFSSFTYLNVTQFLGALNDNIYKLLVVYFFIQLEGVEYSHQILATTGAIFVLPFLLFSAFSGVMADRFSKRDIIVLTKILELVIMGLAVVAFAFESKWGSYAVLFFLAAQSALFGPSKYGIVPELVATEKISKANGLMTSFTFFAMILGTFMASFLTQLTGRNFIISSLFCTLISVIGLVTSFCIEPTPPSGSHQRFKFFFLGEIYDSLKLASQQISLLPAVLGATFFLCVGAFAQLNMIPFVIESLGLTDIEGGYFFFLTALGIGVGALTAGKISGRIVELGLVPIGCLGIAFSFFLLYYFATNIFAVIPLVIVLGFCGGLYEIPLDSYIQVTSPKTSRGQIVAATNFLSFLGVLFASTLIYLDSAVFNLSADQGFALMGALALVVSALFIFQFFDYLARLIGSLFSRIHFYTNYKGLENIPDCPAIYIISSHCTWNDMLLLLGAQRRRIRFFIEQDQPDSTWMRRLYMLLRVVFVPDFEPLEKNQLCLNKIQKALKKGISVAIFVKNPNLPLEVGKLYQSSQFREIIESADYPVIPIHIEKGTKGSPYCFISKLLAKIRVPALVSFGGVLYAGNASLHGSRHELDIFAEDS